MDWISYFQFFRLLYSATKFLDSNIYGPQYRNDLLVGDANYGNIYDFNLDEQRMNLDLSGKLSDKIANDNEELKDLIFAKGFGKVTDMEIGPDGYLYVLSSEDDGAAIYKLQISNFYCESGDQVQTKENMCMQDELHFAIFLLEEPKEYNYILIIGNYQTAIKYSISFT
jgi:hypothetical protein